MRSDCSVRPDSGRSPKGPSAFDVEGDENRNPHADLFGRPRLHIIMRHRLLKNLLLFEGALNWATRASERIRRTFAGGLDGAAKRSDRARYQWFMRSRQSQSEFEIAGQLGGAYGDTNSIREWILRRDP